MPARADVELHPGETAQLSRQSLDRRAEAVGGAAADRRASRRSRSCASPPIPPRAKATPRPATTSSSRSPMPEPIWDAVDAFVASTTSSVRSTSASATAPIRRRWAAARSCARTTNERAGKFPGALVAPQARGRAGRAEQPPAKRRRDARTTRGSRARTPERRRSAGEAEEPEFDLSKLPSLDSIARGHRHHGPSCNAACRPI